MSYFCIKTFYMSYRENRDKEKLRKDKVAGYFFNLSQLTFAALVLGGLSPIYTNNAIGYNWYILLMGLILTILLALIGNKLSKIGRYGYVGSFIYSRGNSFCWIFDLVIHKIREEVA